MKKMFFAVLFTVVGFVAQAQTVTQQSLQGTWNLVSLDAGGISIDVVNKTYTISEEAKKEYGEMVGFVGEQIEAMLEQGIKAQMIFDKDTVAESHTDETGDVANKGTFKLVEGTPVTMECSMEDGDKTTFQVSLKDGNLELFETVDSTKLIYKKAK